MTPRVIYLIKRAEIEITARICRALALLDLTPIQYTLLYFIDVNKGDLSSAQLSRRFSVTPQSMNELIQLLEKKKLLKKSVDPAHRRILRISLTKKGKQLLDKSNKAADELEDELFNELNSGELNELRHLLGQILETAREKTLMEK